MDKNIYVEKIEATEKKAPVGKGVICLVLGGISIVLGGIVGLIIGIVAERFSLSIVAQLPQKKVAKMAEAGAAMGVIGAVLSVINMLLFCAVVAVVIWAIAGGSLFGITL